MTSPLPDIFEVQQGRAMAAALRRGDSKRAEQIGDHLVREAATNPEEQQHFAETVQAATLFNASIAARERGDTAEADRLMAELQATVSPRILKQTLAAAWLHVAREQGYLDAERHDHLTDLVEELGYSEKVRALVASIERRP